MLELAKEDTPIPDRHIYKQTRAWSSQRKTALWVMFKPNEAAEYNMGYIEKFSRAEGCGRAIVISLYSATYFLTAVPTLKDEIEAVGKHNDRFFDKALRRVKKDNGIIICAWGNDGGAAMPSERFVANNGSSVLHVMGLTGLGHPKHPKSVPYKALPYPWFN